MKVALVWNAPTRLVDMTTRFEPYVEGLRTLGTSTITVCPAGTETGYPYPVRTFQSDIELQHPRYWERLGCDAMVIICWHRMTHILLAAREAGLRTLAIGESDGEQSVRHHPWATFRFATFLQPTLYRRLGAAKHWVQRYLFEAGSEHRHLVENVRAADVFTLAGEGTVAIFKKLLRDLGAPDLVPRLHCLPYPITPDFCTGPVHSTRADRVIAVGRWQSTQKNAPMLAAALEEVLSSGRRTEVLIAGRDSNAAFGALARRRSQVRLLGVVPRADIRRAMTECRAVLVPSRWESGPIVASEMLALGGTIIGTPIANLKCMVEGGRFGTVSRSHASGAFAAAIQEELHRWDAGERHPETIASTWRPIVCPEGVAAKLLALLEKPSSC